ncbi:MAG: hypothetical protein L0229_22500 [Blastocatellia bacterium]|nr:hypothetical protein [Blastocatellia bacterium]
MTIKEIQEKRIALQGAIHALVGDFEGETGVMVARILPQHQDVRTLGSPGATVLSGVRVELQL